MMIPNDWNSVFSLLFYDKEISVLTRVDQYDTEGGLITTTEEELTSFFGNVRFTKLDVVLDNLGLRYEIDISITNSLSSDVSINDLVSYGNVKYLITDVIPYDSHLMVVGKVWK
jgi:hypothetical protein